MTDLPPPHPPRQAKAPTSNAARLRLASRMDTARTPFSDGLHLAKHVLYPRPPEAPKE